MKKLFVSILVLFSLGVSAQKVYNHGVFWGRIILTDTINSKLRWELYLQKRTQNTSSKSANIFAAPHFISIWPWLSYKITKNTKVSLSPIAYFDSHLFYNSPQEVKPEGVKEYRASLRLETEQKMKLFNYSNRYSLEYRLRDLRNVDQYKPNWRVRYLFKLEKPISNLLSSEKPLSVFTSNEVFIQFGNAVKNNPNIFDQNRINVGAGYEVFKNVKLSASYLKIIQQRISGKEIDNADALWVVVTFDNLFSQFRRRD
ncbi:MAG TPA: DUF2490 domain-containing protein [Pedobacter sp.]|jgi:hypothetical protein